MPQEAEASQDTARVGEECPPWTRFFVFDAHQGENLTMMCLKQPLGGAIDMPEPCRDEIRVRKIQLGGSEAQVGILASLFGSGKMTSPLCASVSLCLQNKSQ